MNFEKYDFFCPKCQANLEVDNSIVFELIRKNGEKAKVFLSKTIGNYDYKMEPKIELTANEMVDFCCPSCQSSLNSEKHDGFATIKMLAEQKFDFEVLFSRQAGIQKTYIVTEDGMECYGKDCRIL